MEIFPAIDLVNGKCVRLTQGDFNAVTQYHDDPCEVAQQFARDGARWIHIVDLDGAQHGAPVHAELVQAIAEAAGVSVQVGGGIRSLDAARLYLNAGIARIILGTKALSDPAWLKKLLTDYDPQRIMVSLDHRDGIVRTHGWQTDTCLRVHDVVSQLQVLGVQWIMVTDIASDGALCALQPAQRQLLAALTALPLHIVAAGGITTVADLRALHQINAAGAIIGKALYEGHLQLHDALAAVAVPKARVT